MTSKRAKPLSSTLGAISDAHLRNTADLMDKIKDMDMTGKCLASFDVKSLFTNVSVDCALETINSIILSFYSRVGLKILDVSDTGRQRFRMILSYLNRSLPKDKTNS